MYRTFQATFLGFTSKLQHAAYWENSCFRSDAAGCARFEPGWDPPQLCATNPSPLRTLASASKPSAYPRLSPISAQFHGVTTPFGSCNQSAPPCTLFRALGLRIQNRKALNPSSVPPAYHIAAADVAQAAVPEVPFEGIRVCRIPRAWLSEGHYPAQLLQHPPAPALHT